MTARARGYRPGTAREGDEERVSRGLHLDPIVARPDVAQEAVVPREHADVIRAETIEEARRALDVGEQERDRSRGECRIHGISLRLRGGAGKD
jgi:hypothetical protein